MVIARFLYRIFGRPLRGSLYPPRIVLDRKDRAHYRNVGHTQQLVITGDVMSLSGIIFHDDRKPLARWVGSQRLLRTRMDLLVMGETILERRTGNE